MVINASHEDPVAARIRQIRAPLVALDDLDVRHRALFNGPAQTLNSFCSKLGRVDAPVRANMLGEHDRQLAAARTYFRYDTAGMQLKPSISVLTSGALSWPETTTATAAAAARAAKVQKKRRSVLMRVF